MPPLAHRWFLSLRFRWMLGLLLSVALVGAQTLAARHELSHLLDATPAGASPSLATRLETSNRVVAGVLGVPVAPVAPVAHAPGAEEDGHPAAPLSANHDCPLCLMAAALAGTTVAPQGFAFAATEAPLVRAAAPGATWEARTLLVYASRAPPLA
ncbi:MAG TPA: hypothetical protein VH328_01815 [Burkholderiaceae bacterium]|nr:hypothetical protein [Burkholderiaceae bacterium]